MALVGLVGWRGMVGSVLMDRMRSEGDFALIEPLFFSTSNAGGRAPAMAKNETKLQDAYDIDALKRCDIVITAQGGDYTTEVFPKLRWGFIEASAQWVPWIYREAAIRYRAGGRTFPENVFDEYNIFVTCQTNDDVPYIVRYCGEDRLVIGTDYGHTDPSSAVTALNEFQRMEGINTAVKEKILSHNAKALYGLEDHQALAVE